MSAYYTLAPSVANASETARPMPFPAPVTMADFSGNLRPVMALRPAIASAALGGRRRGRDRHIPQLRGSGQFQASIVSLPVIPTFAP